MSESTPSESIYLIELTVITFLTFTSANLLLFKKITVPSKIAEIQDIDQQLKTHAEFVSNCTAIIHAITAFFWGLYIISIHGLHVGRPNNFEESLMLAFSLGYFLSDTCFSLFFHFNGPVMMLHHYLSIAIIGYVLAKGEYSNLAVYSIVIAEASNPFNLLRMILDELGNWKKVSLVCGISFAIIFIYCRLFNQSVSSSKINFPFPSERGFAGNQARYRHHV
jgi:hypothetical protein